MHVRPFRRKMVRMSRLPKVARFAATALLAVVVVNAVPYTSANAASAPVKSAYVKLDEASCTKIDGPEEGDDFQDWGVFRCGKPVAGWSVIVDYGDARESVTLERAGRRTDLAFWSINGGFSSIGPAAEFRMRGSKPLGVVVRHIHVIDPETNATRSDLMVAKLTPQPCVVAQILPGPNQSVLARQAADKAASLACLRNN
jgi:hypothetical protein